MPPMAYSLLHLLVSGLFEQPPRTIFADEILKIYLPGVSLPCVVKRLLSPFSPSLKTPYQPGPWPPKKPAFNKIQKRNGKI